MSHPGDPVPDVRCPNCGGPILYNGNYFCQESTRDSECWVMDPELTYEQHSDFDLTVIRNYLNKRGIVPTDQLEEQLKMRGLIE